MAIDISSPYSRRALLGAGLGALAATVVSSVARPEAADAVSYVVLGGDNSGGGTQITASGTGSAFRGYAGGSGIGVNGSSGSSAGVRGYSTSGDGVNGVSVQGTGVYGFSNAGHGVYGTSDQSVGVYGDGSGPNTGVHGSSDFGYGVYAHSGSGTGLHAASSSGVGILGASSSEGLPAVEGWARGGSTAVLGYSGDGSLPAAPAATGVYGDAPKGRGVVASGGTAQLRLVPASGPHPASGEAGDLFMDHGNRLWLCKGGTTWHQLA